MKIESSLDWANAETTLKHMVGTGVQDRINKQQLYRMIHNLGLEITNLSKAEVLARQGNKKASHEILKKINNNIEEVEEFMLVGALIG